MTHRWLALVLWLCASAAPATANTLFPLPVQPAEVPWPVPSWPTGTLPGPVDQAAVQGASDALFEAVAPRSGLPDTRALVVIHRGRLVHERYAPGFDETTRFRSWSAGKTVTQAIVGVLVGDGELELDGPAPVPSWSMPGDPRAVITLRNLLQMSAGLRNADGGSSAGTFVGEMAYGGGSADTARYAAEVPLVREPGTHWAYSSGTTQILAGITARAIGGDAAAQAVFHRERLFAPLGIEGAQFSWDAANTPLGGLSFHARARDWARIGLLFLRDGVFNGGRILPEGWVDFTRTPGPAANNGSYGAHLWLNHPPQEDQFWALPDGHPAAFEISGNGGQIVLMEPARDLVLVRLGELQTHDWPDLHRELLRIALAFPELEVAR